MRKSTMPIRAAAGLTDLFPLGPLPDDVLAELFGGSGRPAPRGLRLPRRKAKHAGSERRTA